MPFQKVEFEFPDGVGTGDGDGVEIELEGSNMQTLDLNAPAPQPDPEPQPKEPELEVITGDDDNIEIYDDTPPDDQNREKAPPPEDVTEEELKSYSKGVRTRIKHFMKGYHDERREKEAAQRQTTEMEAFARNLYEENQRLKGNVDKSKSALIEQAKQVLNTRIDEAKREYLEAYESGNGDKVLEAQQKLNDLTLKQDKLNNVKVAPLQGQETPVQTQETSATRSQQPPATPPVVKDERAEKWTASQKWWGTNRQMTSFALAVDADLKEQGVDPRSDEYYSKLEKRLGEVFPNEMGVEQEKPEADKPKRSADVVAPATRSQAPKKVRLSKTQLAIAKRLGVSPADYAKQMLIDAENQRNG